MLSKFTNLFIRETRFSLRFVIIIAIILSSVLLLKIQKTQIAQFKKLREEKQLVVKIPELEKQIQIYNNLEKLQSQGSKKVTKKKPVLKGIFVQNNSYYVLIEDTFYRNGDTYAGYDILKIGLNFVIMRDRNTQQTQVFSFPE